MKKALSAVLILSLIIVQCITILVNAVGGGTTDKQIITYNAYNELWKNSLDGNNDGANWFAGVLSADGSFTKSVAPVAFPNGTKGFNSATYTDGLQCVLMQSETRNPDSSAPFNIALIGKNKQKGGMLFVSKLNGDLTFTSDSVNVSSLWNNEPLNTDINFAIYKNSTQIWPESGTPLTLKSGTQYKLFEGDGISLGKVSVGDEIAIVIWGDKETTSKKNVQVTMLNPKAVLTVDASATEISSVSEIKDIVINQNSTLSDLSALLPETASFKYNFDLSTDEAEVEWTLPDKLPEAGNQIEVTGQFILDQTIYKNPMNLKATVNVLCENYQLITYNAYEELWENAGNANNDGSNWFAGVLGVDGKFIRSAKPVVWATTRGFNMPTYTNGLQAVLMYENLQGPNMPNPFNIALIGKYNQKGGLLFVPDVAGELTFNADSANVAAAWVNTAGKPVNMAIYKNGTKIWPIDTASYVFEGGGVKDVFGTAGIKLGTVKKGDEISVVVWGDEETQNDNNIRLTLNNPKMIIKSTEVLDMEISSVQQPDELRIDADLSLTDLQGMLPKTVNVKYNNNALTLAVNIDWSGVKELPQKGGQNVYSGKLIINGTGLTNGKNLTAEITVYRASDSEKKLDFYIHDALWENADSGNNSGPFIKAGTFSDNKFNPSLTAANWDATKGFNISTYTNGLQCVLLYDTMQNADKFNPFNVAVIGKYNQKGAVQFTAPCDGHLLFNADNSVVTAQWPVGEAVNIAIYKNSEKVWPKDKPSVEIKPNTTFNMFGEGGIDLGNVKAGDNFVFAVWGDNKTVATNSVRVTMCNPYFRLTTSISTDITTVKGINTVILEENETLSNLIEKLPVTITAYYGGGKLSQKLMVDWSGLTSLPEKGKITTLTGKPIITDTVLTNANNVMAKVQVLRLSSTLKRTSINAYEDFSINASLKVNDGPYWVAGTIDENRKFVNSVLPMNWNLEDGLINRGYNFMYGGLTSNQCIMTFGETKGQGTQRFNTAVKGKQDTKGGMRFIVPQEGFLLFDAENSYVRASGRENSFVNFAIYKNGSKVWPLDSDTMQIRTGTWVNLFAEGAIELGWAKKGDEFDFLVWGDGTVGDKTDARIDFLNPTVEFISENFVREKRELAVSQVVQANRGDNILRTFTDTQSGVSLSFMGDVFPFYGRLSVEKVTTGDCFNTTKKALGKKGDRLKTVYNIKVIDTHGNEIPPNGFFTIKIYNVLEKLTNHEVYFLKNNVINKNNSMVLGDFVSVSTGSLGTFALLADDLSLKADATKEKSTFPSIPVIIGTSALAVAGIALVTVVLIRKRRK